jgi:PIN domain nuclease of toxin-antitoxin system
MKKYLIDTQVLIWMAQQPENLSSLSRAILESENELFLSFVSIWEMAIKIKVQKLNIEIDLSDFIGSSIEKYNLKLFPISLQHIYFTQKLSLHHRDPFDRLLIAQALSEKMHLISSDVAFDAYDVQRIWK